MIFYGRKLRSIVNRFRAIPEPKTRQWSLWIKTSVTNNTRTVNLVATGWSRESVSIGEDGYICEIGSPSSGEDFAWWLSEQGFVQSEIEQEWKQVRHKAATEMLRKSREGLAENLRPCPICGETQGLGLKPCMTEPEGARCCPWVLCSNCRYTGPPGHSDDAASAVDRWQSGDIDLVNFIALKLEIEATDAILILAGIMGGNEQSLKILPRKQKKELLPVLARELEKRAEVCRRIT